MIALFVMAEITEGRRNHGEIKARQVSGITIAKATAGGIYAD